MKKHWKLIIGVIISSLIISSLLISTISVELVNPLMYESVIIEDLSIIKELNEALTELYNSGNQIEKSNVKVGGGGYRITFEFMNYRKSYSLKQDRLIYCEYVNDELKISETVKVNTIKCDFINRKANYFWKQYK